MTWCMLWKFVRHSIYFVGMQLRYSMSYIFTFLMKWNAYYLQGFYIHRTGIIKFFGYNFIIVMSEEINNDLSKYTL